MRLLYIFILCLFAISGKAQRLTHDFQDTSLSEALIWINNAQNHYKLNFIFDELEDFTVTTSLQNASVRDAVRQVCGFYPMHLTFDEQEIYIECTQKADTKLSGHITNESSQPIAYASITLYSRFAKIEELNTSGIQHKEKDEDSIVGIYTLRGERVQSSNHKGLFIIKMKDGSTKKMLKN